MVYRGALELWRGFAWTQRLACTGWAAIAEPNGYGYGLRLFAVAGHLVTTARRTTLRIPKNWPWADIITHAHHQVATLAAT